MKAYLFALILVSTSVLAIKGEYSNSSTELPSSCKLVFSIWDNESKKTLTGLCSSSFIGNKSFLTAEHCLSTTNQAVNDFQDGKTNKAPYFECPGSKNQYPVKKTISFRGSNLGGDYDLGIVKVESKINLPQILLPPSTENAQDLMKNSECFINGYGLDNEEKYGKLRAAKVIEKDTKPLTMSVGGPAVIRIRKNLGVQGDSGGPMYCQTSRGPVLVGVIHGKLRGDMQYTDLHRVDKVTQWINYHKNNEESSNETFALLNRMQETCMSLGQCFTKLHKAAKLSKEVSDILKVLSDQVLKSKEKALLGETVDREKLQNNWNEMIQLWEKENCYKVLYN